MRGGEALIAFFLFSFALFLIYSLALVEGWRVSLECECWLGGGELLVLAVEKMRWWSGREDSRTISRLTNLTLCLDFIYEQYRVK